MALLAVAAFLVVLVGLVAAGLVPLGLLGLYVLASAASYCMYGVDKRAAERGGWRACRLRT